MLGVAAAVLWWIATAVAARLMRPSLTNIAFMLGMLWSYLAAAGILMARARTLRLGMFRVVAITLALVGGLLALEAAAATNLLDYQRLREALTGSQGPDVPYVQDKELLFRRASNVHWTGRPRTDMAAYFNLPFRSATPLTFSTDNRGFRNLTTVDRADIALVGDSYIEGITVSDNETAAARLQEMTGAGVVNLGVSGYGTVQELGVLQRTAVPLHPKLVAWFFFEGNDLDDDENFEDATAYVAPAATAATAATPPPAAPPAAQRWRSFVTRSFTRNAWLQLRQMTDWLVPNGVDTFGWFHDRAGTLDKVYFFDFYATRPLTDYELSRLSTTRSTLRRGLEIAKAEGFRLVVFYIPIKFRVYGSLCTFPPSSPCPAWQPWDLESRVAAIAHEEGLEFVSLTASMREAARAGELLYVPEDSHWNAAGHAFVAQQLARIWSETWR